MGKLFVFGIGGTGSRVLKSLVMLLMAGVKNNVDEIIPIIIDRDSTNGDFIRTKGIIDTYIATREKFVDENNPRENQFFSTKIRYLTEQQLSLELKDESTNFGDYIKLNTLSEPNRALAEALFSDKALKMCTTEGFRGVPSIGSVVLNQFEDNKIFKNFTTSFEPGDRIFIVSSIFGGTGASGFPLLLKTLRNADKVKEAPIGAISVLPYFKVGAPDENEKSKNITVESSTFNDKAKAALGYYKDTMTNIKTGVNKLYFVGEKSRRSLYKYCAGGEHQANPAHFDELVAALSIIDFAQSPNDDFTVTKYYEFGFRKIEGEERGMFFSDFADATNMIIKKSLIQFYAFKRYMDLIYGQECNIQPWSHPKKFFKNIKDENYDEEYKNSIGKTIGTCFTNFGDWLAEMSGNFEKSNYMSQLKEKKEDENNEMVHYRKLSLFDFENNTPNFIMPSDKQTQEKWSRFDKELNKRINEIKAEKPNKKDEIFAYLFHEVTEEIYKDC